MLDKLMAIIAPYTCIVCGAEGSLLCDWCSPDAIPPVPSRCYSCYAVSQDSAVCRACRPRTRLQNVWVRSDYTAHAKELIYRLKFERTKQAARVVAELLDEAIPYLPPDVVVTYIPTATSRVRQRGYDQTRLIAVHFAQLRKLQLQTLLVRHGQTRQVRATKAQRARQAQTSYSLRDVSRLPATVLVIDDILTTGATLEAAGTLLKQAGAKHVYGAVFAQKQ